MLEHGDGAPPPLSQHKRSSSGSSALTRAGLASDSSYPSTSQQQADARPSYLDLSALSPTEYAVYPRWLATIKPARSGEPEHVEEQDVLRFLREECGLGVQDEIKILSLFERFPLGLLPGHFYALLRLASWVQRGETPSKALLFTQATPPRIGIQSGEPVQPPPSHVSTGMVSSSNSPRAQRNSMPGSSSALSTSPKNARSVPPAPATNPPGTSTSSSMQAPLVPVHSTNIASKSAPAPPVPDDSQKPANPFRASQAQPAHTSAAHASSSIPQNGSAILGFDPAPNPFKQTKPKLVKPTPIVADASTPVLGRPSPGHAVDPFKSGQSVSSRDDSPVSGRSLVNASPPLGMRDLSGHGAELRPPPLPPRHISPLIQASLNARSQVRRKQESLPPKTFTVLQSTQSRHPLEKPRLLTGQAAPPPVPSKRRSNPDTRLSSSSLTGGQGGGAPSTTKASEHVPDRRAGPLPPTIAPKPSYGGKSKTGIPAWLREQEELQRSSLLEHHNEPNAPPRDGHSRSTSVSRRKKRTTSSATRIQFLDNESDSSEEEAEGTLSEQARSAASIDRNNPFFQHGRDMERSVDLKETLSKLAVENAVAKAEHESRMSVRASSETSTTKAGEGGDKRPLGRSKTVREGGRGMMPPAVPPRKRNEAFPATLHSGTYPGFGRPVRVEGPTMGGLRQMPTSRKAEVGLPAHVLAERERMERERHERSATAPLPHEMGDALPLPRRRTSSNSQPSVSDGNTPLSPSDEMPPPSFTTGMTKPRAERISDSLKQDFESLAERHAWIARMTERAKGRPMNEARIGLMDDVDQRDSNDEPEVGEHYLREQRQQRQWQRGNTIDVIQEESTPAGRRVSSNPAHPSVSQRRATDSSRRSLSGAGGLAGLVRRSSLLARGSFGAEDVVSSDTDDDGGSTPRREKDFVLPADIKAPDVDAQSNGAESIEERREAGWQPLS